MIRSRLRAVLESLVLRAQQAETEAAPVEGLTATHAAVLAAAVSVGRREGVSGMARLLGMQQSSITWNVQRLEAMGLLMRIVPEGAKVHSILPTREGAEALARLHAAEEYVQEATFSALTPEERATVLTLLGKVAGAEWAEEMRGEGAPSNRPARPMRT